MAITSADMNPFPMGAITPTPGTPKAITSNFAGGLAFKNVKALIVQAPVGNTGVMYVGRSNLNRSTLDGVVSIVNQGETKTVPYSMTGDNSIDTSKFFTDSDTAGDKLLVAVLLA